MAGFIWKRLYLDARSTKHKILPNPSSYLNESRCGRPIWLIQVCLCLAKTRTNPHSLIDVNAERHACFVSRGGAGDVDAAAADDDDGDGNDDVDDDESQNGSVRA